MVRNWTFREARYSEFSRNIFVFMLTEFNWLKNWILLIMRSEEFSLNGLWNNNKVDADFSNKIIFSDEGNFHFDDYLNRQNCCFWGSENPIKKQMPAQLVTVLVLGDKIELFFVENAAGQALTVNGAHYSDMMIQFLCLNFKIWM